METVTELQMAATLLPPPPTVREADLLSTSSVPVDDQYSDEEFEDAASDLEGVGVDLSEAFADCKAAIHKFFSNDIQGAMDLMLPYAGTSLYHSLGGAIFAFIPAILTFEQNKILEASAAIKNCINICNRNRKLRGIVETIIKKPNYALYSDQEAHAELCYAEALLLQAALTVIGGEDLTGFIKGTLKVRNCHNTYKHCLEMLEVKPWESEESRIHFVSGVRLGTATFNLMISMLPAKFVTLLEFAGFSGNRKLLSKQTKGCLIMNNFYGTTEETRLVYLLETYGLSELQNGSQEPGLRRVLCDLTLLAYHLFLQTFAGGQGDYKICNEILKRALQTFPESVWFLLFKARYELLQGNLEDAMRIYKNPYDIEQEGFREFRHLCNWELMWINALLLDLRASSHYATHLIEHSGWSRATNSYVKATMLMQLDEMTQADQDEVRQLMRDAPSYKMKIAGKSLPMEKFVIKRCARYQVQQDYLILPALELLCLWNLLPILKKNLPILHKMLKNIESSRDAITRGSQAWMSGYESDNKALLHYLHGCVLSAMQMPRQAIQQFQGAVALKKEIKEDHFLVPYAVSEMAMCYYQLQDYDKCKEYLGEARKKYSGYALESRLQFRVHTRQQMLLENTNVM